MYATFSSRRKWHLWNKSIFANSGAKQPTESRKAVEFAIEIVVAAGKSADGFLFCCNDKIELTQRHTAKVRERKKGNEKAAKQTQSHNKRVPQETAVTKKTKKKTNQGADKKHKRADKAQRKGENILQQSAVVVCRQISGLRAEDVKQT